MRDYIRDVRHGIRTLRQRPLLTTGIVLTLGLGLGLNAAVFSMVDALLLRPFPIPDIDRLTQLWEAWPQPYSLREPVSPANFLDWRSQSESYEHLVALLGWGASLTGHDEPERVRGFRVSPGFFEALGVSPIHGRAFSSEEADPGRDRSVILSHRLWWRSFAADPDLVGESVLIDSVSYTVVGIAPKGFAYPYGADIWAPLAFDPEIATSRTWYMLGVIGRLKAGKTVDDARAEMAVIGQRLAREYPETNRDIGVHVLPLKEAVVGPGAQGLLGIWQAAVVLVLLIASANVTSLLLARGVERHKDLALRMALGASRFRVVRQLAIEYLLLSLAGAALALVFAAIGIELLKSQMPANLSVIITGWSEVDVDGRVVAFTAAVAVLTSFVVGLIPAWQAARSSPVHVLKEGARGSTGGVGHHRGRSLLVVTEVAVALMLLIACGLTIRGTARMLASDQGYDPDNLLTFYMSLPESTYPEDRSRLRFFDELLAGARRLPEVAAAEATNFLPAKGGDFLWPFELDGQALTKVERPWAHYRVITPGFFKTMRIPIISGRPFDQNDRKGASEVAIISETMARQYWPGADPVGERFHPGEDEDPSVTVVGVAGDVIHSWYLGGPQPTIYRPLAQAPEATLCIVVRTLGEPTAIAPAVRAQVKRLDPNQPIFAVQSMRRALSDSFLVHKTAASLMGLFGALALLLSAIGIYGLMAYSVSCRTHEIGVRLALGAARRDVLRATVGRAFRHAVFGIGFGLLLSLGAAKIMAGTLLATISIDASTFAGLAVVLLAVALLASYVPARRALRVDPSIALRRE
jgi:putative ABC transport system permease protein